MCCSGYGIPHTSMAFASTKPTTATAKPVEHYNMASSSENDFIRTKRYGKQKVPEEDSSETEQRTEKPKKTLAFAVFAPGQLLSSRRATKGLDQRSWSSIWLGRRRDFARSSISLCPWSQEGKHRLQLWSEDSCEYSSQCWHVRHRVHWSDDWWRRIYVPCIGGQPSLAVPCAYCIEERCFAISRWCQKL